jgi:hypothetical protein
MGWFSKKISKVMPAIGKARGGLEAGLKMFDKAKNMYAQAKSTVQGIPLVGNVAADLIKKQEDKANAYAKQKTGVNFSDVNKGVGIARDINKEVSKILPPSM